MPTIADLMPAFRDYLRHERRMSHNTVLAYMNDIARLNAHIFKDVSEFTLNDLREYQRHLSKLGRSSSTIQRVFACFTTFWRWMRMEGYANEVLTERLLLPRKDDHIPRWLTQDELRTLLHTPVEQDTAWMAFRDITAWRLLAWTGMRQSELAALTVGSIRESSDVIVCWSPKVRKDRILPLPPLLKPALMELINDRPALHYLFPQNGHQWTRINMTKCFNRHLRSCGLDESGITMHSLRHTYATMLVERGASIFQVKELLGHADIKSTMKYVHADPTSMARQLASHFLEGIDRPVSLDNWI